MGAASITRYSDPSESSQPRRDVVVDRTHAQDLARGLAVFGPVALACNMFSPLVRHPELGAAVMFPPYAALTAALVATRRRDWIWYLMVDAACHLVVGGPQWPLSWVLVSAFANVARATTAAALLRWLFPPPIRIDTARVLGEFLAVVVLVAPAVGALIGALNVLENEVAASFGSLWRAWFMSNALTGLSLAPAMVLTAAAGWRRVRAAITPRRAAEATILGVALLLTSGLAFYTRSVTHWQLVLLPYAPLPVLILAALRLGVVGASTAVCVVIFLATLAAGRGSGPFLSGLPDENVFVLQLFVLLSSVPVLCLAAVSEGRDHVVHLHRALLASLRDHVAIVDADGVVMEASDSWRRFSESDEGFPCDRATVGQNFVLACRSAVGEHPSGERGLEAVTSVLSRRRQRSAVEYDGFGPGPHRRYALRVEALERSDGGAVVTRADVTEQHETRMKLEEQQRELAHLSRVAALGEISGALAHELNQPLASISSNAEAARLLLRRNPIDVAELDEILHDVFVEDQRAAQVIRRLRALLKRGETVLQPVDTHELVSDVLELAHSELIRRRVMVTSVVAPGLPPVLGDRVQLQQVLLNLVLNACEAMRAIPTADRRLLVIVRPDGSARVQFSVRDCGSGIAPEMMNHLFEPFVTTKPEGLGLGLTISRSIVAAHGGRLWAENNPEAGATLHCTLTRASNDAPVVAEPLAL